MKSLLLFKVLTDGILWESGINFAVVWFDASFIKFLWIKWVTQYHSQLLHGDCYEMVVFYSFFKLGLISEKKVYEYLQREPSEIHRAGSAASDNMLSDTDGAVELKYF